MSEQEGGGEVTADELSQVQSEDDLTERTQPYFEPDYDSVPDDDSYAEAVPDLDEAPAEGAEGETPGGETYG